MKDLYKKACIVNFATGAYLTGQQRLKKSLVACGYTGDFLFFTDSDAHLFPSHDDSPWGYKPLAIKRAIEKGYEYILWLDSSMMSIRRPDTVFAKIARDGYYVSSFFVHKMGAWCADVALKNFGIDRDTAFTIDEVTPGMIGINARNKTARELLAEWEAFALDGITFRGVPKNVPLSETNRNVNHLISIDDRVLGHRHDQSALSFLVWKYRLKKSFFELKNVQSTRDDGTSKYSKAIFVTAEIVINRDMKTADFVTSYTKWGNSAGVKKTVFIALSLIDTARQFVRHFLRIIRSWHAD